MKERATLHVCSVALLIETRGRKRVKDLIDKKNRTVSFLSILPGEGISGFFPDVCAAKKTKVAILR